MKKKISFSIISVLFSLFAFTQNNLDESPSSMDPFQEIDSLLKISQPNKAQEQLWKVIDRAQKTNSQTILIKAYSYFSSTLYAMEKEESADLYFRLLEKSNGFSEPAKSLIQLDLIKDLSYTSYLWFGNKRLSLYDTLDLSIQKNRFDFVYKRIKQFEGRLQLLKAYDFEPYQKSLLEFNDTLHLYASLSDYVSYQLIDLYQSDLIKNQGDLKISSKDTSNWYTVTDEFVKVDFEEESLTTATLRLFQQIERNNANAPDFLSVAVYQRLHFLLKSFTPHGLKLIWQTQFDYFKNSSARSKFLFELARMDYLEGERYHFMNYPVVEPLIKEAHVLLKSEIAKYPESDFKSEIKSLIAIIEAKTFSIELPNIMPPNKAIPLLVNHKGYSDYVIRVYKIKDYDPLDQRNIREYAMSDRLKLVQTIDLELRNRGLFQQRSLEMFLKPIAGEGEYVLVASQHKKDLVDPAKDAREWSDLNLTTSSFIISKIAATTTVNNNEYTVLVVEQSTGKPIVGAEVSLYYYDYRKVNDIQLLTKGKTDKNGFYTTKNSGSISRSLTYIVRHKESTLRGNDYVYETGTPQTYSQIKLITDRSIYRPGQTVYFKGIISRGKENEFKAMPNEAVMITFRDINYQEVFKEEYRTNEWGSLDGSFTLPSALTLGNFTIRAEFVKRGSGNQIGMTSFSVEEYKRPTYEVKLNLPKKEAKLNDTVSITGNASAFAGYPISNAQVTYSIYRKWNRYWRFYNTPSSGDLLKEDTLKTDSNGEFIIDFFAATDPNAIKNAYYYYEVKVKVTDLSGETHEKSISLNLSEVGLSIQVEMPNRIFTHEDQFVIAKVVNLAGEEQKGFTGRLEIFEKTTNEQFLSRIWDNAEVSQMTEKDFHEIFPDMRWDAYSSYPTEKKIKEVSFKGGEKISLKDLLEKQQGNYIFKFYSLTENGDTIRAEQSIEVIDVDSKKMPIHNSLWTFVSAKKVEVGEAVEFQVGSSFKDAQALILFYRNGKLVNQEWVELKNRHSICYIPEEKDRGVLTYHVVLFNNGIFYNSSEMVAVPFSNKELEIVTSTFRDQLEPGQKEQWTFKIKDNNQEFVKGELAAAMYDASLDQFRNHGWDYWIYSGRGVYGNWSQGWSRTTNYSGVKREDWGLRYVLTQSGEKYHRGRTNRYGYGDSDYYYIDGISIIGSRAALVNRSEAEGVVALEEVHVVTGGTPASFGDAEAGVDELVEEGAGDLTPSPKEVNPRVNFNETAFFYPTIYADGNDDYILNFTLPESLTKWKLLLLAHNKEMQLGALQKEIEAKKELMITANAPRFVRQGDQIYFSAKVVNMTDKLQTVEASILLEDPMGKGNLDIVDGALTKQITVEANSSAEVSWKLNIGQQELIQYTVSVTNESFSDGERNILPVLSNRILVVETDHVLIKKPGTIKHTFDSFKNNSSTTLEHKSFTVEYMDNLAWQAVMALPYMMKENNQSLTALANKYYANAIARHIVDQYPQIKEVFAQWKLKTPDALWSELEKNQELKTILLEETPWVMDAKNEGEQRRRIGLLFELNQLQDNQQNILNELKQNQNADGGFSWFKGGKSNVYITQNILTRFGHLERLKINTSALKTVLYNAERYVANEQVRYYKKYIKDKKTKENYTVSTTDVYWLYTRTFFSSAGSKDIDEVVDFYKARLKSDWTRFNPYLQSLIGIYFKKEGMDKEANLIYASLMDRGKKNTKLGMYWVENSSYFWHQNKISTQAMIISFFQEMKASDEVMDEARLWLILNKEATAWETSSETAEAIYAIFLSGRDYLQSAPRPKVKVGETELVYESPKNANETQVEWTPGLGQIKHQWNGGEVKPTMGEVTIEKNSETPAVLNLYWQYTEELSKIKASNNPSMKIEKRYKKIAAGEKDEVGYVDSVFTVGDKIEVELIVTVDRDLEFVHIKDLRPAGFEPNLTTSGYKWDNLVYYQSPKDVSMDYFVEYMPKGIYKLTYTVYATHSGTFNSGMASVQSFYAPKFSGNSNTQGVEISR